MKSDTSIISRENSDPNILERNRPLFQNSKQTNEDDENNAEELQPIQYEELPNKPPNTPFRQQRLPAWQPIITSRIIIPSLILLGAIMIPLGVVFCHISNQLVEIRMDYTNCLTNAPQDGSYEQIGNNYAWRRIANESNMCELLFTLDQTIPGPVYLYYALTNYYQNHRLYAKSVSPDQLSGQALTWSQLNTDCDPLQGPQGFENVDDAHRPVYYPCGLIANSFFNDTIHDPISNDDENVIAFTDQGIAWSWDLKNYGPTQYTLNGNPPIVAPPYWTDPDLVHPNGTYKTIPNLMGNERFIVWMRIAGLPKFRKLYGQRQDDMPSGIYKMRIKSVFEVISFSGTKSIIITNQSFLGGKNSFLGIIYIVVGSIFLLMGIILLARHWIMPRKLTDTRFLSWSKSNFDESRI